MKGGDLDGESIDGEEIVDDLDGESCTESDFNDPELRPMSSPALTCLSPFSAG